MVNCAALKKAIKDSGIKSKFIAEKIGISPNSLSRKVNGQSDFKLSEVDAMCDILSVDEQCKKNIFFT